MHSHFAHPFARKPPGEAGPPSIHRSFARRYPAARIDDRTGGAVFRNSANLPLSHSGAYKKQAIKRDRTSTESTRELR